MLRRDVTTGADLIALVRVGLPSKSLELLLEALQEYDIPSSVIYKAIGNVRTLQRKRGERSRLSPAESDRLARLARVLVRAEDALGDSDRGRRWIAMPNRALGGDRPIDLLDSDVGTTVVEQVLGRIEHGVYD
ncbi:MAG: DUF2384 domain-containing protein [Gemmatimonadetes bacterium]|nr:DUF2384 domain-containing protein [Gemmatimonadota bacterium]